MSPETLRSVLDYGPTRMDYGTTAFQDMRFSFFGTVLLRPRRLRIRILLRLDLWLPRLFLLLCRCILRFAVVRAVEYSEVSFLCFCDRAVFGRIVGLLFLRILWLFSSAWVFGSESAVVLGFGSVKTTPTSAPRFKSLKFCTCQPAGWSNQSIFLRALSSGFNPDFLLFTVV